MESLCNVVVIIVNINIKVKVLSAEGRLKQETLSVKSTRRKMFFGVNNPFISKVRVIYGLCGLKQQCRKNNIVVEKACYESLSKHLCLTFLVKHINFFEKLSEKNIYIIRLFSLPSLD